MTGPAVAGGFDLSHGRITVYDEEGDEVAVVPADVALRALDGLTKHRQELERYVARQRWAETVAYITSVVMSSGVGAPQSIALDTDYDGEITGTVRFHSVDDLLAVADGNLGEPVGVKSRFDHPVDQDYQRLITYFAVCSGIEYVVHDGDEEIGQWVAIAHPELAVTS